MIPPGGGCFTVVPVEPDRTVYVECPDGASVPGRFVGLIPLNRVPEPAELTAPGSLRSWIRAHGQGIRPLLPAPDGKGLFLTVRTGKGRLPARRVRACLVVAAADGKEPVPLPGVRAAYATAWHTFLLLRRARGFPHPALAEAAEVEFTVRPSFFLPPTTSVTLKEMVVPGGAEFRCALGRLGGAGLPVSVTLEARLDGGTSRTVFTKTLDPGEEAWVPVVRGLEDLAGKGVRFTFSVRPAGRDLLSNERPPWCSWARPRSITGSARRKRPVPGT